MMNNNKKLFSTSNSKYALTENNNTAKNISYKKYDINNTFNQKKVIPNKYRNLTLKEINLLNNNFILNFQRNNCSTFFNSTFNYREKGKNFTTIVYEKKRLKNSLNKNLKIQVKKNFENIFNKNPINIVNININRNNNYIMNINNDHFIKNTNNKIINSSSKSEGKISKFFSLQNFLNLSENYRKKILIKMKKENKDKDQKTLIKLK